MQEFWMLLPVVSNLPLPGTSSNLSTTMELLNALNYHSWSEDAKVLLMEKGCWKFILGTESPLSERTTEKDIQDNKVKIRKDRVYSTLYFSISKEYRKLISDTDDGPKAWIKLKPNVKPSSRARIIALLDEFFNSRYGFGEEMGIFATKLRDIVLQLKNADK
ncbi:hypothetical protein AVEN_83997-1 [Araneus ventricosus]|uniref:DUF4219 domain-containing protein n=1 Tax=Araneus ventricosus TaxID=182803 RepID=A0A4Y2BU87_ARAVE|nr:hypothetical protein AVEN_83997-1 [Araneus ventricosus]